MSEIRVNTIKSEDGTQPIAFNKGINVTGVTTATSFSGSGANLTGVANTDFINATQLNVIGVATASSFVGNVTGNASGSSGSCSGNAATATVSTNAQGLTGTPDIAVNNITGVAATFTGVLTYEDVTNVDSVGMVTARGGLEIGAAGVGGTITSQGNAIFVGVTTVGTGLTLADNKEARFGNDGDLKILHDGSNSRIKDVGTGSLKLSGSQVEIENAATTQTMAVFIEGGASTIYHSNSAKLATSATGVTVTGNATATQFIGVSTGGTASGATVGVGTTSTILGVTDGATQNRFSGVLVEKASLQATNVTSGSIDLAQGNVHYFMTNGSGATTAAIKYKGGNNLSSYMKVGENISVSIISQPNNSEYINAVTIDGSAVTEEWLGGSTPSAASGAASSYTITNINITRSASTGTPNSDYLVLVGVNNYA